MTEAATALPSGVQWRAYGSVVARPVVLAAFPCRVGRFPSPCSPVFAIVSAGLPVRNPPTC